MPDADSRPTIRVLLADDGARIAEKLGAVRPEPVDLAITGTATTPSALFEATRSGMPDVVVVSEAFSSVDAVALADELVHLSPGMGVVVVARTNNPQALTRALRAGVREYLPNQVGGADLVASIRRAHAHSEAAVQVAAAKAAGAAQPKPAAAATEAPVEAPGEWAFGGTQAAETTVTAAVSGAPEHPATSPATQTIQPLVHRDVRRQGKHKCEVFVVFSGKGGVGKSLVAANLAVGIAAQADARVVVVDLDLQFGDIGVMLGVDSHPHTIESLSQHGEHIDSELVEDILATGPEDVRVLLAPTSPELADLVTVGSLRAIMRELAKAYDYIVVDSPSHLEERVLEVIEQADLIIIVTAYNVTTVKDTKVTLKLLQSLGIEKEKIAVVLNQTRQRASYTREEIEDSLRFRIAAHIPYDPRLVDEAIDHGKPIVTMDPKNDVVKQFKKLAEFVAPPTHSEDEARAKGGLIRRRFSLGRS